MDYKKKYKEAKLRNKSLVERIEGLKTEIADMKNYQEELDDYSNCLIDELEDMRYSFLCVIDELNKCKEEYNAIKKILLKEKKSAMLKLKISNMIIDIKYKIYTIFKRKK